MISAINNNQNFQGFYKVASEHMGENTAEFFANNYKNIQMTKDNDSNDIFIHVPDNKETEKQLEDSIKKDNGKYWKARPLDFLMDQRGFTIFSAVFKADKGISHGRENWVDYTV